MQLGWFASLLSGFAAARLRAALLSVALVLGCSQDIETSGAPLPPPDIETLRSALAERDELERTYLLTRYLRELSPEDISDALAEVERNRVGITADEVRLFMLAWTRFDGPGAFATARNWPTPWKTILTEQAIRAWGFNDGRAALAEWKRIEDEELKDKLRGSLVAGWVGSYDLDGVTEFAATVEESRRRNRLVFRLTGQTMRDGPEAVIAWAEAVPIDAPNHFKQTVFSHAVGSVARKDPDRAASWYEQHLNESFSAASLRNVAIKWAQHHDPRALISWVESLPLDESREPERADAIRAAMRIWAAADPEEAERWLVSAAPSPGRDAAIGEFALATIDVSPNEALEWVARIGDEALRKKSTFRLNRLWWEQDAEAAAAWLEESDIPGAWREQIVAARSRVDPHAARTNADPDA